jgi:AcrR family transcriptional regulator
MLVLVSPQPNPERSAVTRTKLLDATIEALVDVGWAGTSTTEVVRRAGVSRGAQVHHYPTKQELVLAAVEHLLLRRVGECAAAFQGLDPQHRTHGAALDLLWRHCFGPSFEAWLELAVAARSDPLLHGQLVEFEKRLWETALETFKSQFPEAEDDTFARVGLRLTFAVLDGLVVGRLAGTDPEELDEVLDAFKAITAPYFPNEEAP